MVSVLAFYFDDTSSTPADTYSFFYLKRCLKNLNKQKEARLAQFCKKKFIILTPLMLNVT